MRFCYYLVLSLFMLLCGSGVCVDGNVKAVPKYKQVSPTIEMVLEEIELQARSADISVTKAVRIAECESTLVYNASNSNSTAKGVYQFTDPTWDYIDAPFHQFDYKENIKQFMKWYQRYPSWWVCT